jgi:hypothetical protein
MTVCYHGTPVTPQAALLKLAGRHFCVSYFNRTKTSLPLIEGIASSLMLDNGAFSAWQAGVDLSDAYWSGYFDWCDPLLDRPTTWAVIPDAIASGTQEQDRLIRLWPHGDRGAPVYHLTEDFMQPLSRLVRLTQEWPRVCIGWAHPPSTHPINGAAFERAMDALWNELARHHRRTPVVHMFRGMQLVRSRWPFASVDSTDVARNHNRPQNTPEAMAARWDAAQCPARWEPAPEPMLLEFVA